MSLTHHFSPFVATTPARARGCLTCTHFHGQFFCGHVLCERDGGRHVVGVASMGCAFWEREPGADDELDYNGLALDGDERLLSGVLTGEVTSEQLSEGICSKQRMGLETLH
jgi:hypothetical protein